MTKVIVHPGICGFDAFLEAINSDGVVKLQIKSECEDVKKLAEILTEVSLKDLIGPLNQNKVYKTATKCISHSSCPIVCAIIKAVEVELGLALKKDVTIKFDHYPRGK